MSQFFKSLLNSILHLGATKTVIVLGVVVLVALVVRAAGIPWDLNMGRRSGDSPEDKSDGTK